MAGRVIGHHAEALAAREVGHRGGGPERERGITGFGQVRPGHLQRKGGGLGERIVAALVDLARMRGAAGKMQLGAQEPAAADDDAVVARVAQRHALGQARDGREIGTHAAEAAGMLVGIEQHVERAARQTRPGKMARDMGQDGDAGF